MTSEIVRVAVVNGWPDSYRKVLLEKRADGHYHTPVFRLNFEALYTQKDVENVTKDLISDFIRKWFDGLTFKSIKFLGRTKNNRYPLYMVEFEGWPEPKDEPSNFRFVDPFNLMPKGDALETLSKIEEEFKKREQKKTSDSVLINLH